MHIFLLLQRSICLLLQIALPCLLFAKERSELLLRGGTDVDMAPPINYTLKVILISNYCLNFGSLLPEGIQAPC